MSSSARRFPNARCFYRGAANGDKIEGRRIYGEFVGKRPFLAHPISRLFDGSPIDGEISRFFTTRRLNLGPPIPIGRSFSR